MDTPKKLKFLHIDKSSATEFTGDREMLNHDVIFSFIFDLSNQIKVETRTVISFPQLFGELGGLYEFISTFIVFIVGRY